MSASTVRVGYGAVLGRQASNLTTIAASTTGSQVAQSRTPASMTSINVDTILVIDTASATVKEPVKVTAKDATTFTSIIQSNHSGGISIALAVPVVELTSLGMPTLKCDPVECTHLLSDNVYREYLAGIPDGGEIPFEGNYIPTDASQLILVTDLHARTKSTWVISLGGTPGQDNQCLWMCNGFVAGPPTSVERVGDLLKFSATLKLTGKPQMF